MPLLFQLHCIINNNVDIKTVGLTTGSKLLVSLKSRIINLASMQGISSTIQQVAQSTLQSGWSILLPTANERAQTLSSLLPNTGLFKTYQLLNFDKFTTIASFRLNSASINK